MKIGRIPDTAKFRKCNCCSERARLEIVINQDFPILLLCHRDGRYLAGVVQSRIGEAEQGIPIPKPGQRINAQVVGKGSGPRENDARGNR